MPPFLILGDSYGDARMGISRLFGFCFAFLFASSVVASTIDVGPSSWRNYGTNGSHTPQGVRSTFTQNVRLPPTISGPTRVLPVSRNPVIPYGSIANGMKNFVRVSPQGIAASAAVTGLFLAVDWVFDHDKQQWSTMGEPTLLDDPNLHNWEFNGQAGTFYSSSADALCQMVVPLISSNYVYRAVLISSTGETAQCRGQSAMLDDANLATISRVGMTCPAPSYYDVPLGGCVIPGEYEVVTDSDFSELEAQLPALPPGDVALAAADTQRRIGNPLPGYTDTTITGPSSVSGPTSTSTSTDPATGSTTVTETSTQINLEYGDTTITTTTTTTTNTHMDGQHTGTETTVEGPGELPVVQPPASGASEWPGFCEWATVVCDWFDWTQEEPPPEEDLPQPIDEDFYEEKTISFGSKACPPDHEINLGSFLSTSVSVSFQPLCDFAGLVYYMVMAASYIIAAYISIGVARNG